MELLEECITYLKQYPVYEKIMTQFRQKYISLSRFGGTVLLDNISRKELDELQGFFGILKESEDHSVKITARRFEKALENSRFCGLMPEEVLKAYFGGRIETKKEVREQFQNSWTDFLNEVREAATDPEVRQWLDDMLEHKKEGYQMIRKKFREDGDGLRKVLGSISKAAELLPVKTKTREKLPVFAAKVTGNPHYFDESEFAGKLLLVFLSYYTKENLSAEESLSTAERNWNVLYRVGIIKDELWNYILAYGIQGRKGNIQPCPEGENGGPVCPDQNQSGSISAGYLHPGLAGFYEEGEPVHMSLLLLGSLESVSAREKTVYVVENPSVFSALIEHFPKKISILCTNGQLHLAALVLMDLLRENGYEFLYGGDFDPEGLGIADRLKQRYGESFHLWLYEDRYYKMSLSTVEIGEKRLSQLEHFHSPRLRCLAESIRKKKQAGYQEKLIDQYVAWVRTRV